MHIILSTEQAILAFSSKSRNNLCYLCPHNIECGYRQSCYENTRNFKFQGPIRRPISVPQPDGKYDAKGTASVRGTHHTLFNKSIPYKGIGPVALPTVLEVNLNVYLWDFQDMATNIYDCTDVVKYVVAGTSLL